MTVAFDAHGLAPEAVLSALDAIVASPAFEASERNKRFLRFVVTEALAGRADHIKAYTIATVVFGRDASFDPQADPIIRIEASRLRRALEHYYLTAGRDAAIRIEIPKGSYVPAIVATGERASTPTDPQPTAAAQQALSIALSPRVPAAAMAPASRPSAWSVRKPWVTASLGAGFGVLVTSIVAFALWMRAPEPSTMPSRGPSIVVMPFDDDGSLPSYSAIAKGFSREILVSLTRHKDIAVYADRGPANGGTDGQAPARQAADYLLNGAVSISESQFRGTVTLIDAKTGRHLWAQRFEAALSPPDIFEIRENIAASVIQSLAEPYGVIFAETSKSLASKPPKYLSSYECVVQFYAYQRTLAASKYDDTLRCLEHTVATEPSYGMAWSSLAILYVDAHRYAFARGKVDDPLPRARDLAQQAIDRSPAEAHGYKAMHNVLWLMNDVPGSLAMGERAVAISPSDTEALGDLGARRFYTGNWEGGLALLRQTFERNPAAPSGYRIPLALHAYFLGRYDEALAEARRINLPDFIYTHVLVAMAAAASGHEQESAAAVRRILAIDPAFGANAVADLRSRNQHPRIIRAVADGLGRAGLPVQGAAEVSEALPERRLASP